MVGVCDVAVVVCGGGVEFGLVARVLLGGNQSWEVGFDKVLGE